MIHTYAYKFVYLFIYSLIYAIDSICIAVKLTCNNISATFRHVKSQANSIATPTQNQNNSVVPNAIQGSAYNNHT